MEETSENKRKLRERLKDHYRLVILNDDTLSEVSNYKLSVLNIYLLLCSAAVLIGLLVILLIVFTPIKTLIPGYGEMEANKEFIELTQKTKDLEQDMLALTEYMERNKNRLMGTVEVDSTKEPLNSSPSDLFPINLETPAIPVSETEPKRIVNKAKLGQYYLLAPISGPVSADFDPNGKHFGVDILGPKNTAIKAIMDGYVISSDWTLESGNTVAIQHANNIVSFYKHNSSILKKAGSFVQAGEAIAIIGNSGTLSDGPHLHFELWYNGHPVNPAEFINF